MLIHQDGTNCTGYGCQKKVHNLIEVSDRTLNEVRSLSRRVFILAEPMDICNITYRNSRNALHLACLMLDTAIALIREGTANEPMTDEKFNLIMGTFLITMCEMTK